jgi:hypothetical protein
MSLGLIVGRKKTRELTRGLSYSAPVRAEYPED